MKGLISGNMNSGVNEDQPPEAEALETEIQEGGGDAQEDEVIERVSLAAQQIIYGDEAHDHIMSLLKSGADDPASALADTTSMIMIQLDEKAGGQIPDFAVIPASVEALTLIAELATKAGLFQADEQVQAQAVGQLINKLGQHYGMDDEDLAEMQQIVSGQQDTEA